MPSPSRIKLEYSVLCEPHRTWPCHPCGSGGLRTCSTGCKCRIHDWWPGKFAHFFLWIQFTEYHNGSEPNRKGRQNDVSRSLVHKILEGIPAQQTGTEQVNP